MEDNKYLPPKYSYALKDLADDFGCFEKADVASMISGVSTNLSMVSGSVINGNDPFKEKDITFPLSPIREQRALPTPHMRQQKNKQSNMSKQVSTSNSRFKNPVYNEIGSVPSRSKRSIRATPRREKSYDVPDRSML